MEGKYQSSLRYMAAYAYRQWIRRQLRNVVSWSALKGPKDGCTAVIGMCHRLPDVLLGNLRCLAAAGWPDLKEVIIVVDSANGCLPRGLEQAARETCARCDLRLFYYSEAQAQLAERLCLPYVFAWLSWCIGLSQVKTRAALLHDYDAFVLDESLARRYELFLQTRAAMQGIRWYEHNGVRAEDRLVTTFEAFLDAAWVRSFRPIQLFNQIAIEDGVSRDYDILLEIQHRYTPSWRRTMVPMDEESLVHPSQMIHQYTMFRRQPGAPLPCFSMPMIPFFAFLSGKQSALHEASERLRQARSHTLDLFGDGTQINLSEMETAAVDWALKQMVRVCVRRQIAPFGDLCAYGEALYALAGTPEAQRFLGDFAHDQRAWLDRARSMYERRPTDLASSPLGIDGAMPESSPHADALLARPLP